MTYSYPAHIVYSEADLVFEVDFPDLPGCLTFGETFENASEAITGYLESVLCRSDARRGSRTVERSVSGLPAFRRSR